MRPEEIRQRGLLPAGFMPLPHVKQATRGQVFPDRQIDEVRRQEDRDLRRFDVNFDLPDHLTPEFPPPIFLTTQPHLGDVSRGQLLTIKNFYELMNVPIVLGHLETAKNLLAELAAQSPQASSAPGGIVPQVSPPAPPVPRERPAQ
jgi:cytochrome c peroxidase